MKKFRGRRVLGGGGAAIPYLAAGVCRMHDVELPLPIICSPNSI